MKLSTVKSLKMKFYKSGSHLQQFHLTDNELCRYNVSNTLVTTVKKKKKPLVAFVDCEILSNTNIYSKHVHTEPIPLHPCKK